MQRMLLEEKTKDESILENRLWKYADVANFTQESEGVWRRRVMRRECPFLKIGKSVRFDPVVVKEWIYSNSK